MNRAEEKCHAACDRRSLRSTEGINNVLLRSVTPRWDRVIGGSALRVEPTELDRPQASEASARGMCSEGKGLRTLGMHQESDPFGTKFGGYNPTVVTGTASAPAELPRPTFH